MGIQGLTTYIVRHSDQYLEPYELHDTYLVIDGNSVASQLYNWYTHGNCAFGGDYDKYAECLRKFFDSLIKCKVIPLVLIDGGYENKKVNTIKSRLRSKIQVASHFNPSERKKFFPLLMKEVFKDVMDEKGVRYAQCAFEADDEIAAVARILGCPVLSYDSDFFIYGTLYIPYDTLDNGVVRSQKTDGLVKKCKIYRVEKFLNSFGGLDRSLLPLVATLLGNDYIKRTVFRQFFNNLKLSKLTKKTSNEQQRRITALLNWLQPFTLNSAVAGVLSRIQSTHRRSVLRKMEQVINGYSNSFPSMMIPLGFSQEYVAELRAKRVDQSFKFQGDIDNSDIVEELGNDDEDLESDDEAVSDNVDEDEEDNDDDDQETGNEFGEADLSIENFLPKIATKCQAYFEDQDFDLNKILDRIIVTSPQTYDEVLAVLNNFRHLTNNRQICLIILDSLTFLRYTIEISLHRTQICFKILDELHKLSTRHNLAVVVTKELTTHITGNGEVDLVPAGGNLSAHRVHKRIMLTRLDDNKFAACIIKSLTMPKVSSKFQVTADGIRDIMD